MSPCCWWSAPLLLLLVVCTAVPGVQGKAGGTAWQSASSVVGDLWRDARAYTVSLLGPQRVDSLLHTSGEVVEAAAAAAAHGLNVAGAYIVDLLGAAGIDARLPVKHVTPAGVLFVTKWALLALIGYWLLSVVLHLLVSVVRQTLFLMKLALAVVAFGLILNDTSASAETTAMRLGGLVLVCVVLGVGPSCFGGDRNSHLEHKVKLLERRLREVEGKSKVE